MNPKDQGGGITAAVPSELPGYQGGAIWWGPVEFQAPRGRRRTGARLWLSATGLVVLGVWAVAGTWHRNPVVAVIAGLVYLELSLAVARAATVIGGVVYSDELAARIASPLIELCRRADCDVPKVVIRDDSVHAAAVRRGRGQAFLITSREFVEQVDDRQLRAILAHEVAHIARGDLRWARLRAGISLLVVLAGGAFGATLHGGGVFPLFLAAFIVAFLIIQVLLALPNRPIEMRTDRDGAWLAGSPQALADALRSAHRFSEEARNRVYGKQPWRWLLSPLSWQMPTHPSMAKRISRLDS